MARLFDTGIFSVNATNGSVGVGYKLHFYTTGTSTPKNTYPTRADAVAGTNANANPVVAASDGRWNPIWLTGGDYKVVLKDFDDVTLETRDPADSNEESQLSATTGAGLVGFSHSASYAAGTVGNHLKRFICVTDAPYSATGDGTTDDTAAFTAAIAAVIVAGGGTLWIPAGTFKVTSALTVASPMRFVGGGLGSIITTTSATANVFTVTSTSNDPGVEFEGLYFKSTVTRSAGYYIESASANGTKVRRCRFEGAYNGIGATGTPNFQGLVVEDNEIIGTLGSGVVISAANGTQGCVQFYIRRNKFTGTSNGSQTPIAILVTSAGDLMISHNHTLFCSTAVALAPATGNDIQAIKIYDNWFDSGSASGVAVSPTGGTIRNAMISRNWIATFTAYGIVASGTGLIKKLDILDNTMGGFSSGINAAATIISDLVIAGNAVGQCSAHGIATVANLNNFRITGNSIGAVGEFTQNGGWDIVVNAGTSTNYIIANNRMTGGVSGTLSDGGSGAVKYIRNNIGYINQAKGATSVADGGAVTHGLVAAPTTVRCTPTTSGEFVSVTSLGASNFTVSIKKHDNTGGTTQTIYWEAEV
jgi:hypothetical protein